VRLDEYFYPGENEMTDKRDVLRNTNRGFFQNLVLQGKLILRLLGDKRVNQLLKILPFGGLIYLLSPIDLFPDIAIPVLGFVDDAFVIWLCLTLFVALCPDKIVQEHLTALEKVVTVAWRDVTDEKETGEAPK
jgi:uncharacterized membrane protein YkvA (DUF1232 family)